MKGVSPKIFEHLKTPSSWESLLMFIKVDNASVSDIIVLIVVHRVNSKGNCIGKYLEYIWFRDSHEEDWAVLRLEAGTQTWALILGLQQNINKQQLKNGQTVLPYYVGRLA